MNKKFIIIRNIKTTAFLYVVAVLGTAVLINACQKSKQQSKPLTYTAPQSVMTASQNTTLTSVYTIANIRKSADGKSAEIFFNRNEEIFTTNDASLITAIDNALQSNTPVKVTYDPWKKTVLQMTPATDNERKAINARSIISSGSSMAVDINNANPDVINNAFVINTTSSSALTATIPDMATAQSMFDYIAHQCCALSGPYAVDYCISFQYCEDGCYARAHKMCWILNNRYHYATQKVFSFANSGSDQLSVKAEKWGGCCINWWYHVAPLVTIKTTKGPKAFVFDPAMFDQPVLLTEWLHAQENPACVSSPTVPHVSMINVQPTASYSPADYAGTTFDTDPAFASTDTTMVHYGILATCR